MEWINVNFFDTIEAVKTWLLLNVLVPVKRLLLEPALDRRGRRRGPRRLAAGGPRLGA